MADVIMPKMGDAMTEGKVIRWLKRPGEVVRKGEPIAEIETDKVNVEIEAEESGTLSHVLVEAGGTAPVGQPIAVIGDNGAPPPAAAPPPTEARPREQPAQIPPPEGAPVKASPLARQIARERGVDLTSIRGTGPGGRVVEQDVLAAAQPARVQPAPAEYEDVPFTRMRRAIADRVSRSNREVPHFYVTAEADMTQAQRLREDLAAAHGEQGRVTVNDLVIKAAALALRTFPNLNAHVVEGAVRRFTRVNVGIMVAVPDGLLIPVVHDADRRPLLELAAETRRVVEAARSGRLRQEDLTGATFSTTNLGMYEVRDFAAVISPPEVAILAVGTAAPRPVAREGQVSVAPVMAMTIAADHRATDGVEAARFLVEVKRLLEHPPILALPD